MITIISGTGRENSQTKKIASIYLSKLKELGMDANFIDLEWLQNTKRNEAFEKIETEILIPTQKFIIIVPEYNGAFPGIFKLFIDLCDVKKVWWHKKIMITGVSSGRAGNNRGLDILTNIFNYLKANVFFNKIPLSQIELEIADDGKLIKPETSNLINEQLEGFIKF